MDTTVNGTPADRIAGVAWRKSTHSGAQGNCVEVAALSDGDLAVRNSRFPTGPALVCTRAELSAFLAAAEAGEFDDVA
ncbi:MAG: DUF397 domain-containing protein [Thermocrispum sp.]